MKRAVTVTLPAPHDAEINALFVKAIDYTYVI